MLTAADYRPPHWLRSPHVQSVLGSSPLRRRRGAQAIQGSGAISVEQLVDGGDGVRLHGLYSHVPGVEPRGLALLLHGWEGRSESSYMCRTVARLLAKGFATLRVNFHYKGNSHHLNEALFHSYRIVEVVHAAVDIARRLRAPSRPMVGEGYSLVGNFIL